jgi:hypothetical protein
MMLSGFAHRSFGGTRGEVLSEFKLAVTQAIDTLQQEADPNLRTFWNWKLEHATAELKRYEERAKEELEE